MMMKKFALLTLVVAFSTLSAVGQRFAFIDTEYILENIPEYQAALQEINQLSVQWQNEVEAKFAEIDQMYRRYQAEAVLLPEELRRQREEEIIERERQAKNLQMQRFGREGDLFKRRQELIRPIQDQVFKAVEEIANRNNYVLVFDKAGGGNIFYADTNHDLSDQVLQRMGYRR